MDGQPTVELQHLGDFRFEARFGHGLPALQTDEQPPLGQGQGPSPVQMLATAVGNCLSASLLFAFRKFKEDPAGIRCAVQADVGRNAEGRMRVLGLQATLTLGAAATALPHAERVVASFESYCTVTQSVRQGIPVQVTVVDATGTALTK
ncbi:OsmC family protein [Pseudorhodoferax sp.]|uniref:OsmC family protein n=1 Tax=Pseudorhodoferax sp. TaxID=1993553 RepID=UPI002DD672EC|nr:OsmC family protein [Pseudorhodoferax sp.]